MGRCKRNRLWASGVLACSLIGLIGCTGGIPFAEVEGTVTQNGKPLERVRVEFHPDGQGPRSTAMTDAQGRYVLQTDDGSRPGAAVGSYRVVLRDMSSFPEKLPPRAELERDFGKGKKTNRLRPEFGDPAKTALKATVTSDIKNVIDFEVK